MFCKCIGQSWKLKLKCKYSCKYKKACGIFRGSKRYKYKYNCKYKFHVLQMHWTESEAQPCVLACLRPRRGLHSPQLLEYPIPQKVFVFVYFQYLYLLLFQYLCISLQMYYLINQFKGEVCTLPGSILVYTIAL